MDSHTENMDGEGRNWQCEKKEEIENADSHVRVCVHPQRKVGTPEALSGDVDN